jgi:opacity protein-like surface antigen
MTHRLIYIVTGCFLTSYALAENVPSSLSPVETTWVTSISAGPTWARGGKTQTLFLTPMIEKTYVAQRAYNALASGELFVGFQRHLSSQWLGQFGVAIATTGEAKLQGEIWDDADPQFNNYTYAYQVNHTHVALKAKIQSSKRWFVEPFASVAVGIGINRASQFSNTPTIFEAIPAPNFSSHTTTSLSYAVAVGGQKRISDHISAGLSYEFSDWGNAALGPGSGQSLTRALSLSHLITHSAMFNLTYTA